MDDTGRRLRASHFTDILPIRLERHASQPKKPSKQQLEELRRLFRVFDDDNDGFLHFYQAMRAWRHIGLSIDRQNVIFVGEHFPSVSFDTFMENVFVVQANLDREQEARRVSDTSSYSRVGY
jgi:hypothetical protein